MIGIYKITSPSNKIYIGQSRNIEKRFNSYKRLNCKSQIKLYNSLLKYGYLNHKFEIIEKCKFENLNIRERYYQELYDVISKKGLNLILTPTQIKPYKSSIETFNKKSNSLKGRIISKEWRLKLSKSKIGKKLSKEHKLKISNNSSKSKKIINIKTNIIYNSITEAAKIENINRSTLKSYLLNIAPNKTNLRYYAK